MSIPILTGRYGNLECGFPACSVPIKGWKVILVSLIDLVESFGLYNFVLVMPSKRRDRFICHCLFGLVPGEVTGELVAE